MVLLQNFLWTIGLVNFLKFLKIETSVPCGGAEYRIGTECCPMCAPGKRVREHCNKHRSTSCTPCTGSTYLDKPNGLTTCTPCTHCDPVFGLMVKQPCRPSSDTVCEPLEGFYCTDPTKDGCKSAQRHSSCKPGQYIRQKGAPSTDVVCADCNGETYSDGSFTSCQLHKKCEMLNRHLVRHGTNSSNSECGPETSSFVIVAVGVFVTGAVIALISTFVINRKTSKSVTPGPGNTCTDIQTTTEDAQVG